MNVTVRFFARARDLAGAESLELDIPSGSTVGELRLLLSERFPKLATILPLSAMAMADDFAEDKQALTAGVEIALLPPVSGGSTTPARVRLTNEPIDFQALTESVRHHNAGAVVLFLGTVREMTGSRQTVALDYEAYPAMAEKKMHEIAEETGNRWPVLGLAMEHRLGHLELGDVSVALAVSCPHRAQAFEAGRFAIDRLKEVVPIWKRERWADGTTEWVHPGLPESTS